MLIKCKYTEKQKSSAQSLLTLSKPIVSCRDGGEYRCSEVSMSWSTVHTERRAGLKNDFLWIFVVYSV